MIKDCKNDKKKIQFNSKKYATNLQRIVQNFRKSSSFSKMKNGGLLKLLRTFWRWHVGGSVSTFQLLPTIFPLFIKNLLKITFEWDLLVKIDQLGLFLARMINNSKQRRCWCIGETLRLKDSSSLLEDGATGVQSTALPT